MLPVSWIFYRAHPFVQCPHENHGHGFGRTRWRYYPPCIPGHTHTVNCVEAYFVLYQAEAQNCRYLKALLEAGTSALLLAAATRLLY
jgi:hypothetical protein